MQRFIARLGSIDLRLLASALLTEHREENDPPTARDVVGDAHRIATRTQVETQLTQFSPQLAAVGMVEEYALLGQEIDMELDPPELALGEPVDPVHDLGLEFDRSPRHALG